MHAILFQVDLKQDFDGDPNVELDEIVAMTAAIPGFLRGTWAGDGRRAMSLILVDSEELAKEVAARATVPPGASATLRSVDVYEVMREA